MNQNHFPIIFYTITRFVVEEQVKKSKKKKPRVIHALGNMKWGFAPQKNNAINVDALQNKWDREHAMKERVIKCIELSYFLLHHLNFVFCNVGKGYFWVQ